LVQDDGGTLMPDGSFHGYEGGGIFVKTENVGPAEQMEIFYGLLKKETVLENVYVDKEGDFDFYNLKKTSNGRAVILRSAFMHASPYIDVDRVDNIILITRGPIIPAISKLTLEQVVALMIVGQAMESSAGDPTKAGMIRSEFFYDPFVAGDLADHANRFYEILKDLPNINYYLLNTGGIGEGPRYRNIGLENTLAILDSLFRGGLNNPEDWKDSPTGFKVPVAVRQVDDSYFHPEKLSSGDFEEDGVFKEYPEQFEITQKKLTRLRQEAIDKIGDRLHPAIRNVFKEK